MTEVVTVCEALTDLGAVEQFSMVVSACATLWSDSVVSTTARSARTGAPRTRASARASPAEEKTPVEQLRVLSIG